MVVFSPKYLISILKHLLFNSSYTSLQIRHSWHLQTKMNMLYLPKREACLLLTNFLVLESTIMNLLKNVPNGKSGYYLKLWIIANTTYSSLFRYWLLFILHWFVAYGPILSMLFWEFLHSSSAIYFGKPERRKILKLNATDTLSTFGIAG